MKKIIPFFLSFLLMFSFAAYSADPQAVRLTKFEGEKITGVTAGSGFEVELSQGGQTKAVVEVNAELEKYLIFELRDGILRLGIDHEAIRKDRKSDRFLQDLKHRTATVVVSSLEKIGVSSSAKISCHGNFNGKNVAVKASSSGRVSGLILACGGTFAAETSSSGSFSGLDVRAADGIECKASSSGFFNSSNFSSEKNASLSVSSSGSISGCKINAGQLGMSASSSGKIGDTRIDARQLDLKASSSGRIEASGKADKADINASSSGKVDISTIVLREARANASSSGSIKVHVTDIANFGSSSGGQIVYSGSPAQLVMQGGIIKAD